MDNQADAALQAQVLALLCELVKCPTENLPPRGNEACGQAVLGAYYAGLGLTVDRFSPEDLPEYPSNPEFLPRELKGRENMVATWRGSGGGKSLLLTGHMDVAPKEPMPWQVTEPFVPLIKDGRVYGRGTADMKGGLCCAAAAVAHLKAKGFVPKGDVILESVVDEEYAGANGTIASRLKGYNTDFAVVLEPSGQDICPACVGGMMYKLTVRGTAGMPYTGEEIASPAYDIAEVIQLIKAFSIDRMENTERPPLWDGTVQGAQIVITKVKAGEAFEGGQLSAPIDAWIELVMQAYPGETEASLESKLRAYLAAHYHDPAGLLIEPMYHYCRPSHTCPDDPGVRALAACAKRHLPQVKVCGAMFSCDMFALTEIGHIPSAIFGPIGARLHAPDEWVSIESLLACTRTLCDLIEDWCG
ncbi:MAG: M20/M25/M40 family metallo-hydrolase [Clostridia bacterium]